MRDFRIDNAKGILIFLVVLGHFLESFGGWKNEVLHPVLVAIYMFHMPAFVFLSGVTAKCSRLVSRIAILFVVLLVFHIAYSLPLLIEGKGGWTVFVKPYWFLWYLLAMIWWLAFLPIFIRLPGAFLISIAISLLAGFLPWDGYLLSYLRALVFLPFFVLGARHGEKILQFLSQRKIGYAQMAGVFLACVALTHSLNLDKRWLYGSFGYGELAPGSALSACLIRVALILCALLSTAALLALVPSKKTRVTKLGEFSLAVFLLHGFAVLMGGKILWIIPAKFGSVTTLAVAIVVALLVTVALAQSFFDQAIRNGAAKLASGILGKKAM